MFKPLLMMRTRGITGVLFGRHFGVPKLSRSAGNAYAAGGALQPPMWDPDLPDVNVGQGLPWTQDLNDYVSGDAPMTFVLEAGNLPTGISLNSDGTFSGTVTNLAGSGTAVYKATNGSGESVSSPQAWAWL